MTPHPAVTCIMPTRDRRAFVARAIQSFLSQDYPNRELLILDDGADQVGDLAAGHPQIRHVVAPPGPTLGEKRNAACALARGELVAHWDDDDWSAPTRLSVQVEALLRAGAALCGLRTLRFVEPATGRAWEYRYGGRRPWLAGSSLLYRRATWATTPFPALQVGEDASFVAANARYGLVDASDPTILVGVVHPGNTSPKGVTDPAWRPLPAAEARSILQRIGEGAVEPTRTTRSPDVPEAATTSRPAATFRNVYACLVHERPVASKKPGGFCPENLAVWERDAAAG